MGGHWLVALTEMGGWALADGGAQRKVWFVVRAWSVLAFGIISWVIISLTFSIMYSNITTFSISSFYFQSFDFPSFIVNLMSACKQIPH